MMIQIANWDTNNFGIKVGNLILNDLSRDCIDYAIKKAKEDNYDLLYLKGVSLPNSMLSERIKLVDEKIIYTQIVESQLRYEEKHIRSIRHCEINSAILSLAYESGKYSRFFIDDNMPPTVFKTLYCKWIENSLNGENGTDVLAYYDDENIQGLLTYSLTGNIAIIGLIAVAPQYVGKGIGTKLMKFFLSRLPEGTKVDVATQKRNTVACHYYEKNGFQIESITNVYHIWLK